MAQLQVEVSAILLGKLHMLKTIKGKTKLDDAIVPVLEKAVKSIKIGVEHE